VVLETFEAVVLLEYSLRAGFSERAVFVEEVVDLISVDILIGTLWAVLVLVVVLSAEVPLLPVDSALEDVDVVVLTAVSPRGVIGLLLEPSTLYIRQNTESSTTDNMIHIEVYFDV
jgi:hypothetical protein